MILSEILTAVTNYLLSNAVLSLYLFLFIWPLTFIKGAYASLLRYGLWIVWLTRLALPPALYFPFSVFGLAGHFLNFSNRFAILSDPGTGPVTISSKIIIADTTASCLADYLLVSSSGMVCKPSDCRNTRGDL